ncbi:MAG: glycosyltransferase [Planctomycetes bacterium]|nr:glycosyltransferase [Planctomycetota bacterium]
MNRNAPEPEPRVSIVVITADRCADLRRCLRELAAHLGQPGTPPAEVLTVHAPGDDAAAAMVQSEFPWVACHRAARRGIGHQRNVGARLARGEVVTFLDDDAWPRAGWLAAIDAAFVDPVVVAASGPVVRGDGSRQFGRLAASALGRIVPVPDGAPVPPRLAPTFSGCNLSLRRRALLAAGGFDENLVYQPDDIDVCRRLFVAAGRSAAAFAYRDAISVHHESSPGPYRRTLQDRAWFTVARDTIYFGFRHAGTLRAALCAGPLQLPRLVRFVGWLVTGRLGPIAFVRCTAKLLAGIAAGYGKGLCRRPVLPLAAEPTPRPTTAAPAPRRAPQPV